MGLLNEEYHDMKGDDEFSVGGELTATVLDCAVTKVEEKTTKDGKSKYIQLEMGYIDGGGKERLIRYQNFNPKKSDSGRQLWINLLIVAGATSGAKLKGKKIKVVVQPEEYQKDDGSIGVTLKPWPNGYFSSKGWSATEVSEKKYEEDGAEPHRINLVLAEALEAGAKKLENRPAASGGSGPVDNGDSEMPF
jgi:hypothetical protein